MSVSLTEDFARDPDWTIISDSNRSRAQELVELIQKQINVRRDLKNEEYYGWLIELNRILH